MDNSPNLSNFLPAKLSHYTVFLEAQECVHTKIFLKSGHIYSYKFSRDANFVNPTYIAMYVGSFHFFMI